MVLRLLVFLALGRHDRGDAFAVLFINGSYSQTGLGFSLADFQSKWISVSPPAGHKRLVRVTYT